MGMLKLAWFNSHPAITDELKLIPHNNLLIQSGKFIQPRLLHTGRGQWSWVGVENEVVVLGIGCEYECG
jgi:hypothetical protein